MHNIQEEAVEKFRVSKYASSKRKELCICLNENDTIDNLPDNVKADLFPLHFEDHFECRPKRSRAEFEIYNTIRLQGYFTCKKELIVTQLLLGKPAEESLSMD